MEFVCRLGTPDGRVREELREARDADLLRRELEREGFHVFDLRARSLTPRLAFPRLFRRRRHIPVRTLLIFNKELATLLKAGLPLLQALDLMLERQRDPFFRNVLSEIRDGVRTGEELSEAVGKFGAAFPLLYSSSLKAGERSGELELVIRRFVRYQELLLDARKRVTSALVYPAVLLTVSTIMIIIMLIYVVPKFRVLYRDMNAHLPLITTVTLAVSEFLRQNWPFFLAVLVALVLLTQRWTKTASGRQAVDRWKLKLPVLGGIYHRFAISEMTRALSTLLAGGIPLVPSLETSIGAVGNSFVRRKLLPTIQAVKEGETLNQALENSGVFSPIAVDMVKVGEATGALATMLSDFSEFIDEEVETRLQRLLTLIEPIMLVMMGIIVATLLISVYLPMYSVLGQGSF
ncbi:MAG TPA: type II secretion system F family protein [Candidatus Krumholzibacteria bacterium]|nr:type II secretion system F family protein [Candidatus Krumholzibacteria bacterium]